MIVIVIVIVRLNSANWLLQQVLGVTCQLRPSEPATGAPERFYSLTGLVRTPESADISAIDRAIQEKRDSVNTIKLRVAALRVPPLLPLLWSMSIHA